VLNPAVTSAVAKVTSKRGRGTGKAGGSG
jgi:hypothetical protein